MIKKTTAVTAIILIAAVTAIPALSAGAVINEKSPAAVILGDTDGDEKVTIMDATHIQRHLAEMTRLSDVEMKAADADGDEMVTIMDATAVQRWLAGFDSAYPIGEAMEDPDDGNISVKLTEGEEYAAENYYILSDALYNVSEGEELTVTISEPGTYYVGAGRGALRLCSGTTLDLNGSTLIRSGSMGNLLQNTSAWDSATDGKGYTLSHDITVKNGTLDGSGGATDDVNLCNFGHAERLTLSDITFLNNRSHLVEFAGCSDCEILNCTFTGYLGGQDKPIEALQFDICDNTVAGTWNGVYESDGTVCRNMTVDGCTFLDYPSGVGNHKGIAGNHNSNITIKNSVFKNTLDSTQSAIWAYDFDDSLISDNEISGRYGCGIKVSAGDNVTVSNNTVKLASTGIYVTVANSYTAGESYVYTPENTSKCKVTDNTVSVTGSKNIAFCAYSGSKLAEISRNSFTSADDTAATVSGSSTVTTIADNTFKSSSSFGLLIATSANVTTISGSTISSKNHGIQISSDSVVKNIKNSKKITSTTGNGIYVTSATAENITGNTVKSCGVSGIMVTGTGKVSKITSNTVTGCAEYGIRVNNSSITITLSKNTCTGNKLGATKISAKISK